MIYCIILIVILTLQYIKQLYRMRTINSTIDRLNYTITEYKKYMDKYPWLHYVLLTITSCLDLSVIGYLIYAACNL